MSQQLPPRKSIDELQQKQKEKTDKVNKRVDKLPKLGFKRSNFDPKADEAAAEKVEVVLSEKIRNCLDVVAKRHLNKG
jgi:Holliday junction resolvasome RuvABC DNA-binding subunit